jgi:hypothetical protein
MSTDLNDTNPNRPTDEEIVNYEEKLKNNDAIPLVADKISLDSLLGEYNQKAFTSKIEVPTSLMVSKLWCC